MNSKLTAGMVLRAAPAPGKDRLYVWDTELRGFGLMVTAAGHKSYVVQYRAGHRSRRMTISGVLPVEQARKEARAILGSVAKGGDPVAAKRAAEAAQENTLAAIGDRYLASRAGRGLRTIDQRRGNPRAADLSQARRMADRKHPALRRRAPARANRRPARPAHGRLCGQRSEDRFPLVRAAVG